MEYFDKFTQKLYFFYQLDDEKFSKYITETDLNDTFERTVYIYK